MAFSFSFVILQLLLSGRLYANGCYTFIISFGDSLADTGNLQYMASVSNKFFAVLQPPYGETFFHKPTGRCSNGRLIIDFLAESLGFPLVPPFLHSESDNVVALGEGVNYAVVGATALDSLLYDTRLVNISLSDEFSWFKQSWASFCSNVSDCRNLIGRSLIMMGEIGGSDYNYLTIDGKSIENAESSIHAIIDIIISIVNELIDMGAQTLVVPGTFPVGCSSLYLTLRASIYEQYDNKTGCLTRFNKIAEYHNELLQAKLNHLRELHPNVTVIYADYYNAAMQIFRSPHKFGFTNGALKACCGFGGGLYNYDLSSPCGYISATVCDDPDTYVQWDGIHYTEETYKIIFNSLFQGPYTTPQFNLLCPTSSSQVGVGLLSSIKENTSLGIDYGLLEL